MHFCWRKRCKKWKTDKWDKDPTTTKYDCSKKCGAKEKSRTRKVECFDPAKNVKVADDQCTDAGARPTSEEKCSAVDCDWNRSDFKPSKACPTACGVEKSTLKRTITCRNPSTQQTEADNECKADKKGSNTMECKKTAACSTALTTAKTKFRIVLKNLKSCGNDVRDKIALAVRYTLALLDTDSVTVKADSNCARRRRLAKGGWEVTVGSKSTTAKKIKETVDNVVKFSADLQQKVREQDGLDTVEVGSSSAASQTGLDDATASSTNTLCLIGSFLITLLFL